MVVVKRKRREKPTKIEQRKAQGLEWKIQIKQTALLASPIYIGQAQGEAEIELGAFLFMDGLLSEAYPTQYRCNLRARGPRVRVQIPMQAEV